MTPEQVAKIEQADALIKSVTMELQNDRSRHELIYARQAILRATTFGEMRLTPWAMLTIDEVAAILKMKKAKVKRLVETHQIRGRKFGSEWRIRECDLVPQPGIDYYTKL